MEFALYAWRTWKTITSRGKHRNQPWKSSWCRTSHTTAEAEKKQKQYCTRHRELDAAQTDTCWSGSETCPSNGLYAFHMQAMGQSCQKSTIKNKDFSWCSYVDFRLFVFRLSVCLFVVFGFFFFVISCCSSCLFVFSLIVANSRWRLPWECSERHNNLMPTPSFPCLLKPFHGRPGTIKFGRI